MSDLAVPIDDSALSAIEHALSGVIHIDDAGEWHREGSDHGLDELLRFWSGYDPDDSYHDGYISDIPVYVSNQPRLTEHDLIRALIAEIRRLRPQEDS